MESYGPFEAPSPHNPCMRTAKRGPYCTSWGFAVYAYNEAYNETGRKARARSGKATSAGGSSARHGGKGAGGGSGGSSGGSGTNSHAGGHAGGHVSSNKHAGVLRSDQIMKEAIDTPIR